MTQSKEEEIKKKLFKADKDSISSRLAKELYPSAVEVAGKRAVALQDIVFEHPANPDHGDYSTNLAMQLFGRESKKAERKTPRFIAGKIGGKSIDTPWDLAHAMVNDLRMKGMPGWLAKIEVAKPGFINIWLKNEVLISQLKRVLEEADRFGSRGLMDGKKILLEHTSPNPQTTIMLGHLRNNFLGMAVFRLWQFLGADVTLDCVVHDRGVHISRAIWGYLVFGRKRVGLTKEELLDFRRVSDTKLKKAFKGVSWRERLTQWQGGKTNWWYPKGLDLKPDHANLIWYVLGSRAYQLSEEVQSQVRKMVVDWEKEDKAVREIWSRLLGWSKEGYAATYERVGSHHDHFWYEHDFYREGREWVDKGLKKEVFRVSEGAVVSDLAEFGLPDTVLLKSDGATLYHTGDLELTNRKRKKFPADLYVWDIGVEQTLYLKQLFAMCQQLGIGQAKDYYHLSYALINYKGGKKMATRTGDVVTADRILNELQEKAVKIIKGSNQELRGKMSQKQLQQLAETVAVGAIKYSLLKFGRETTIQFDPDESLSLEGNSGPYLQYTHARCQSVLGKDGRTKSRLADFKKAKDLQEKNLGHEELALLKSLYRLPEVVEQAAQRMAPNLLGNYLYDLAQKYNLFYQKCPILKARSDLRIGLRLALTAATAQVLKNGLNLLGIKTPEKM